VKVILKQKIQTNTYYNDVFNAVVLDGYMDILHICII